MTLSPTRGRGRRDPADFAAFVRARSASLHRAAYLLVGERGLAQDLVQEALTKTYVAWPRLRDPAKAEAYTRKAITTTAIGWYRRKGWHGERPVADTPQGSRAVTGDHAERVTEQDAVWAVVQSLPPRQRAAVVLRYYEDLTEAQTAERMGCAVGTVKSQVSAALATLRRELGDAPDLLPASAHDDPVVTR